MTFSITRYRFEEKTGVPLGPETITDRDAIALDPDLQIVKKWGGRMTRETSRLLSQADRRPAPSRTGAGRDYDAERAMKYCEMVSGHKPAKTKHAVLFRAEPLPGEKVPRAYAVRLANGDIWPIPHWDWQPAAPIEESVSGDMFAARP
jgi:hypothetical protein